MILNNIILEFLQKYLIIIATSNNSKSKVCISYLSVHFNVSNLNVDFYHLQLPLIIVSPVY